MRKMFIGAALSILIGVTTNVTASASSDGMNDISQNELCRDGYETRTDRTSSIFLLTALPCGDGSPTRTSIKVTVPLCDGKPKLQEHNIKTGQNYFRFLADHARQSFRLNKAGYAAYARYAREEPVYSECASS